MYVMYVHKHTQNPPGAHANASLQHIASTNPDFVGTRCRNWLIAMVNIINTGRPHTKLSAVFSCL